MDLNSVKERLPGSAGELEQALMEDFDTTFDKFKDVNFISIDLSNLSNSFELWKCVRELDTCGIDNQVDVAMKVCKLLQYPMVDAVYNHINIIPKLINNDKLFDSLCIAVIMHMVIPQLQPLLPQQVETGQPDNDMTQLPGPLTLKKKFQTPVSIDLGDDNYYYKRLVENFTPSCLFNLLNLYCQFQEAAYLLHQNPAQAISDTFDLWTLINNEELSNELTCITFHPYIDILLQLIDSPGVMLAANARTLYQNVIQTLMNTQYQLVSCSSILSQSFSIPREIFHCSLKRIHFDVLFEALDNASRCFTNGSFVRLLALAASCLEKNMTSVYENDYDVVEFNRVVTLLSPPLSSLAIQCHLIYQTSKALLDGDRDIIKMLNNQFDVKLPPIPLRHFETSQTQTFACATQGMEFEMVDNRLLADALNSLLCTLSVNMKFYSTLDITNDDDGGMEEFNLGITELVVQCLLCAYNTGVSSVIFKAEQLLINLPSLFPQTGLVSILQTSLSLGNQSIKLAGQCISLISQVLEPSTTENVIINQLMNHEILMKQFINKWQGTNIPAMKFLISQLNQLGFENELNFSVVNQPVLLDLSKLRQHELMPPPLQPVPRRPNTRQSQNRLVSSKSFPNLAV